MDFITDIPFTKAWDASLVVADLFFKVVYFIPFCGLLRKLIYLFDKFSWTTAYQNI